MNSIDKKPRKLKADLTKNIIANPKPLKLPEVRKLAQLHAPAAIERMAKEIHNEKAHVALWASKEILDRGYDKPGQQINIDQTITTDYSTVLARIGQRMVEAGVIQLPASQNATVIDATVEEVDQKLSD